MSKYHANTADAQALCEAIGWDFSIRPLKTVRRGGKLYVTGVRLKPEEQEQLRTSLPPTMPDGTEIVLVAPSR